MHHNMYTFAVIISFLWGILYKAFISEGGGGVTRNSASFSGKDLCWEGGLSSMLRHW